LLRERLDAIAAHYSEPEIREWAFSLYNSSIYRPHCIVLTDLFLVEDAYRNERWLTVREMSYRVRQLGHQYGGKKCRCHHRR
jgi:hypothetical protein